MSGLTVLGRRLRHLRQVRGWSLRQTARKLGVSHPYLCDVENGNKTASRALLRNASNVFMEPYETLVGLDLRSRPIRIDPRLVGDEVFCAILDLVSPDWPRWVEANDRDPADHRTVHLLPPTAADLEWAHQHLDEAKAVLDAHGVVPDDGAER